MRLMVQTERILANLRALQKQLGSTPLIPVLEANAHGLGDVEIARLLQEAGVGAIAVARLEEAVRVAQAVRGMDILLLTPYSGEEDVAAILQNDIIGAVGSNDAAVLYSSLSRKLRCRARVQLCFDFGMGRFGYALQDAGKAAQTIKHLENVELSGVFTVLPDTGKTSHAKRLEQVKELQRAIAAIQREGLKPGVVHMADAFQAMQCKEMRLSAVRAGADLFGRGPLRERFGLKRIGRAVSSVCDLKWLSAGSTVGDDAATRLRKATRVAVVPAGRADGLFTGQPTSRFPLFRKKLTCEINGKRPAIIGRPGLTSLTVDVTDIDCAPGDIVAFDADPVDVSAFIRRDYV